MATAYRVTGVRTAQPYGYGVHEHITAVRVTSGGGEIVLSSATVIADIKSAYGDRYYTLADGAHADVIVKDCPRCGHPDYLTTTPDWTEANNLLSLPRI